jgi:flagellar L-ring protein precursor FlgH
MRDRIMTGARGLALFLALMAGVAAAESLYREGTFRALVADNKARKVGDAITVLVYESSSAASSADTTAGRKAGLGIDFQASFAKGRSASLATRNDFDGSGTTQRAGRLLAQIGVTVVAVEANGELRIAGEQLLEINRERQQIKLEGRVRPQDVTDANTVMSTRLAEARISYVGDGDVSLRTHPSWWHQLLTLIGL